MRVLLPNTKTHYAKDKTNSANNEKTTKSNHNFALHNQTVEGNISRCDEKSYGKVAQMMTWFLFVRVLTSPVILLLIHQKRRVKVWFGEANIRLKMYWGKCNSTSQIDTLLIQQVNWFVHFCWFYWLMHYLLLLLGRHSWGDSQWRRCSTRVYWTK